MYWTMKCCLGVLFGCAFRKAIHYIGSSILAAMLFPVNVILIERCIGYMEKDSYQEFWLTLALFASCSFVLVWTEYRKRVLDVELSHEFAERCMPEIADRLNRVRYSFFDDAKAADALSRLGDDPAAAMTGLFKKIIDCISLLIRLYGAAFIYFRLSCAVGLILLLLLGVQIYIGILSQREVVKLYEAETQEERKLQYLGELLCGKDSVFDLKVNQSVSYIESLQNPQG